MRFTRSLVASNALRASIRISFALTAFVLLSSALFAIPLLTGSTVSFNSEFHWEVYAQSAPDNPNPKPGELTYVYWQQNIGNSILPFYYVDLGDARSPGTRGVISDTGFVSGSGSPPTVVNEAYWSWNWPGQGTSLFPGERSSLLYVNSRHLPGDLDAFIPGCNPFLCFFGSTPIVGPVYNPADFNGNGSIDAEDLSHWQNSYASDAAADADEDGDTDGMDLLTWQRAYNAGQTLSTISLPEPTSLTLGLTLVGVLASARRHHVRDVTRA